MSDPQVSEPSTDETIGDPTVDSTVDPTGSPSADDREDATDRHRHTGRRVAFVVGSGRSGTSTMSGTLQALGMYVPQPEVSANETNPRGFGEPKWVVDFHERLLNRVRVQTADARPSAWLDTGRPGTREVWRNQLHDWLVEQFETAETPPSEDEDGVSELCVKDPRLVWFISMWRSAAIRCHAEPSYITMLRPPTEVVGSKQKYYAGQQTAISRTAGWVNVMLHTELATRDSARAFVRYSDLLTDWTVPVYALGEQLQYDAVLRAKPKDLQRVHAFIDPALRRVQVSWDDLGVPGKLREFADETWQVFDKLAEPGGDTPDVRATLGQIREAYVDYYETAEAITQSTAASARMAGVVAERDRQAATASTEADGDALSRLPHGVRAMVPESARRAVRERLARRRGDQ